MPIQNEDWARLAQAMAQLANESQGREGQSTGLGFNANTQRSAGLGGLGGQLSNVRTLDEFFDPFAIEDKRFERLNRPFGSGNSQVAILAPDPANSQLADIASAIAAAGNLVNRKSDRQRAEEGPLQGNVLGSLIDAGKGSVAGLFGQEGLGFGDRFKRNLLGPPKASRSSVSPKASLDDIQNQISDMFKTSGLGNKESPLGTQGAGPLDSEDQREQTAESEIVARQKKKAKKDKKKDDIANSARLIGGDPSGFIASEEKRKAQKKQAEKAKQAREEELRRKARLRARGRS